MESLVRPAYDKMMVLERIVSVLLSLLIGGHYLYGMIASTADYASAKANRLEVAATVTEIVLEKDSEGDTIYQIFGQYTHEGNVFRVHLTSLGQRDCAEEMLGETIFLTVDSTNPGIQLEEARSAVITSGVLACVCLGLSTAFMHLPVRKQYIKVYGWQLNAIEKDLYDVFVRAGWFWKMLLVSGAIMILMVFLNSKTEWFMHCFIIGLALLCFALHCGIINLERIKQVKNGEYEVMCDQVVDKHIFEDSEEGDKYIVYISNGTNTWKRQVTRSRFLLISIGDTVGAVYIKGNSHPVLSQNGGL